MAMLDLRRTDLRGTTLENPYWVTSAEIAPAADDAEAVLFSFPLTGGATPNRGLVLITIICCEIITGFVGGTPSMTIGTGSIPLETSTTGATVTITDADDFFPSASITEATPGIYFPAAGDWLTAAAAQTFAQPVALTPLDADVPVLYAALTSGSPITAGAARVHALMHRIPLMG